MSTLNVSSVPEFDGSLIPDTEINKLPLMPARTAAKLIFAIGEDLDTLEAVGAFRRPIDHFDHEANPQAMDPRCEMVLVYQGGGRLYVMPLVEPGPLPPTPT